MSVDSYNLTIPAGGSLLLPNPGNFFFLFSATSAVTVQFQSGSARETFNGFIGGLRVERTKLWASCQITGTPGAVVVVLYGGCNVSEDDTAYVQTIATIAGDVRTTPGIGSPNTPTDHADVPVATTAVDTTIAANAARKMLIVGSLSSNAPASKNLRLQGHPGSAAAKGIELAPGTFVSLPITAAMDVYNPDANSQTYWWQELT